MVAQNQKYLMWCRANSGPIFGDGHDLYISDKCNKNRESFARFPHTYNLEGEELYKKDQYAIKAFSGADKEGKFKVEEY